ncbi:MAG: nuclear transport factor 2 family protein [Stagnimonas sp.]|nr:nuclear transport factor 2 family protein [Stagnimonas sp.]
MRDAANQRIVSLFETFAPADVQRLHEYYCDDAYFKDPFNDVRGLDAIQRVYAHMFDALDQPRFVVTQQMAQGAECWLVWEFQFRYRSFMKGRTQVVRGASHLVLAADGRIRSHRDYWDAAEEVYEKLPVIGLLMRWLKRRARS